MSRAPCTEGCAGLPLSAERECGEQAYGTEERDMLYENDQKFTIEPLAAEDGSFQQL